jgi:pyridoxal phosphate enzyme (YggS family)
MTDDARRDELAANLAEVRARMGRAAQDAGRDPTELTLVAVTKTWPAADVRRLVGLGVHDIGENRDQEAAGKAQELRDLPIRWHFVGQLQTNKVTSVVRYASVVESVDRARLAAALDRAAERAGRTVRCLVQVALDDVPGRGGAVPADVPELAADVASRRHLVLAGLMAVAPLGADPDQAFSRLAGLHQQVLADHPGATTLSAGMSGDLEAAVRHGATHVRIGTAVLGHRPGIG